MGWFSRKSKPVIDLDPEVLTLGNADRLLFSQTAQHVAYSGMTGAGKTTAVRHLTGSLLQMQCSFVVACVKPDEGSTWVEHCQHHGRGRIA
ncbi:MAG: hypothetical protein R3B84_20395 [Zavarzinella sp.]